LVALYSNIRFTDWLFMGLLFHRDYMRYPEFWRRKPGEKGEAAAVIYSVATGFLTCGIRVCRRLNRGAYLRARKLALAVWAMAPLLLVTNAPVRQDSSAHHVAHALGWLRNLSYVRLSRCGL
jgi:hypothetical protein